MKSYLENLKELSNKLDNFPLFFAYSKEDIEVGRKKIDASESDKLIRVNNGAIMKKENVINYRKIFEDHEKKHHDSILAIHNEDTKESQESYDYIYDMVTYELGNHEYVITYDIDDTINACDLKRYTTDETVSHVVNKAIKDFEQRNNMLLN